jgi:hypothetical protein
MHSVFEIQVAFRVIVLISASHRHGAVLENEETNMPGIIVKTVGATLLLAGLSFGSAARADDVAGPIDGIVANENDAPQIVLAYGGCGVFGHRGPYGGCRPGGQFGGYIPGRSCPAGFHIGPFGRHCWLSA